MKHSSSMIDCNDGIIRNEGLYELAYYFQDLKSWQVKSSFWLVSALCFILGSMILSPSEQHMLML